MTTKIAITGGLGFIGFNLIKEIIAHHPGINILVIDNLISKTLNGFQNISNVEISHISISKDNASRLTSIIQGCETVVHLAAFGGVEASIIKPWDNFVNNVEATLVLLEAIKNSSVEQIIFSSTGGALMGKTLPPVNEMSLPLPISPYGSSKLACEGYIRSFCECYDLKGTIFRFGNVYGPWSQHKQGIVNKLILASLKNEFITIRGDGSSTRDYIHVKDICQGVIKGMEYSDKCDPKTCNTFHLANGVEVSLNSLLEVVENISSSKIKRLYSDELTGEVTHNFAQSLFAKSKLNFTPQVSLDEGIRDTFEWYNRIMSAV